MESKCTALKKDSLQQLTLLLKPAVHYCDMQVSGFKLHIIPYSCLQPAVVTVNEDGLILCKQYQESKRQRTDRHKDAGRIVFTQERHRKTKMQRVTMLARACWLLACFTSQQHGTALLRQVYRSCCTMMEVADQTCYLTQSQ